MLKQPRKKPLQERSIDLVSTIFEATVRILNAPGAVQFSTRRVAELAGVSVGSLYQYFPNKEALLGALIERESDRHLEILQARYQTLRDQKLEFIIENLITEILGKIENDKHLLKSVFASVFAVDRVATILSAREKMVAFIEEILRDQIPDLNENARRSRAYIIVASLAGVAETLVFRNHESPSLQEISKELSSMIFHHCLPVTSRSST